MIVDKRTKIVILIDFLNNNYRNIIPVALLLRKDGMYVKIIATDKKRKKHPLYKLAKNTGSIYGFLDDFCNISKQHYLEKITGIYKKKLRNLYDGSNKTRLFLYNNLPLWDSEIGDFGNLMGVKRINNIFKHGIEFKMMLDAEAPDLLIFSDEQSALGKLYALIANRRRIRYLCLPDLGDQLLWDLPIFEFEKRSRYAVLGRGIQKVLARRGVDVQRFTETGSPLADTYCFIRPQFTKEEILGRLNLDKNNNFFLFTMQESLPENKQILKALVSAMKAFPNKYLIIRPHPVDRSARNYYPLIRRAGIRNVIVSKRFNINDLISASEMVITVYSLSGFHAIIKGKPLISINLSPFPDNMPYVEYEAALGVRAIEDLPQVMKRVLSDIRVQRKLAAGRKRLLRDYPTYNSDTAKSRIRDLVIACIK